MSKETHFADRCRVVLVRPTIAANIGATSRVMRNFGLTDLRLVAPHADPLSEEARKLSTHGEAILHAARSVTDLGEAVADCVLVAGTSARTGGLFRNESVVTPRALMPKLVEMMADGPVALVFGPEPSGLSNTELTRCHYLINIPADETYPALNLAQAVAICLYELFQAGFAGTARGPEREVASFAEQERMYENLRQALTELHFLYGDNAGTLMHALRHLIGRAGPSKVETNILLGLARQIRWFVQRHGPITDRPSLPPPANAPPSRE